MAEYRTIRMAFWNDPFIEELEAGEKLLYLYLFTCPHTNNLGVLEISRRKIAFETGLDAHVVESALERLKKAGKVVTDGNFILLTRFIRHQTTTSPKLAQSLKALLSDVPSETLRDALVDGYPEIFGPAKGERYPAPASLGAVTHEDTAPDGMRASSAERDTVSTDRRDDGYPMDRVSTPYQYPIHTQPNGRDTAGIPSGEEEEEEEIFITTPDGVVVDAAGVSPLPERDGQAEESSQDTSAGEEHAGQVAASSLPPEYFAAHPQASPPVCPLPSPAGKEYTGEYAQGNDALLFFPGGGLSTHGENLPGNSPERVEKAFCDQLLMSGKSKPLKSKFGESGCPPCPHERILAAYHEALPELPSVKVWDGTRKSHLQARWRERWKAGKYASQTDGVAYWTRLFRHVRTCDWLMGRVTGRDGRAFKASLGWLVRPENFAKLIEGRYDRQEVAA